MLRVKRVCALALIALLSLPAMADDGTVEKKESKKDKKGDRQVRLVAQLLKQLEPVGLTEEQISKIKALGKASGAKMSEVRKAAGITSELTKKRAEVQKSMDGSEKKGKELRAAIDEAAGVTKSQIEAFKAINEARLEFQQKVVALLTDDQKKQLPERLQRAVKLTQGKKKKKDAE